MSLQPISQIRLVSRSASIRQVERDALLAARGEANILIVGERGPVKAALARFIHNQSDRSEYGFASLRCDRLTDELIRSALFGLVDACVSPEKPGLLTPESRGTVFLDEVGSLGAATQSRLLRHIDTNVVDRPSSIVNRSVRLIASTALNLRAQVDAGMFLPELYDRISAVTLVVPPPDERRDDIRELQISA